MPKSNKDTYQRLLDELSDLYRETLGMDEEQKNALTKTNYWKMGRRIIEVEQQGKARAAYGDNLMDRLSADLTERFGKGFKQRTVYYIRDFAGTFGRRAIDGPLTWSHYKALMRVEDEGRREELTHLAAKERIAAKKLERLVTQLTGTLGEVDMDQVLVPREARPGIGKVVVDAFAPDTVLLDLGFNVQVAFDGPFENGDYVAVAPGRKPAKVEVAPGERYCYDGVLLEVVDGDTVNVRLDLGFGVRRKERLRLRGVGAPELDLESGKNARAWMRRKIKPGDAVRVLTYGHDRHHRYVADLFYKEGRRFLNRECIASGHAVYVDIPW